MIIRVDNMKYKIEYTCYGKVGTTTLTGESEQEIKQYIAECTNYDSYKILEVLSE